MVASAPIKLYQCKFLYKFFLAIFLRAWFLAEDPAADQI